MLKRDLLAKIKDLPDSADLFFKDIDGKKRFIQDVLYMDEHNEIELYPYPRY